MKDPIKSFWMVQRFGQNCAKIDWVMMCPPTTPATPIPASYGSRNHLLKIFTQLLCMIYSRHGRGEGTSRQVRNNALQPAICWDTTQFSKQRQREGVIVDNYRRQRCPLRGCGRAAGRIVGVVVVVCIDICSSVGHTYFSFQASQNFVCRKHTGNGPRVPQKK